MKNTFAWAMVLSTILLTVYGQLILKWRVSLASPVPDRAIDKLEFLGRLLLNPWVISGLGAAFAASLCWMLALTKLPLNTAYPFTALSFLLVLLLTAIILGEPVSTGKILGTLLIFSGLVVMAVMA